MKSSLEIAQEAELQPIDSIAERAGLLPDEFEPYGRYKAKVSLGVLDRLRDAPDGKLVCVAGVTPTKAGEGKTTTAVSLTQGLGKIGKSPLLCLREPSLGPVFGIKGGAAGGGLTQVVPMEDLNLHFTGDIHAVGAANNLLAALLDASILHGNPHSIDALRVDWKRALDMNDRALRRITLGLGGRANGYPRESGFDITAASEVMAILAVSRDLQDLRARLGRDHGRALLQRRQARDRRGPRRRRGHGRAAEGGAQAQPDPDARGPAVPDARGAVRQHRARQLVARGGPDRAQARRPRDHRVRLRLRHGDGEAVQHRLPRTAACVRAPSCSWPPCARSKHHGGIEDDPRVERVRGLAAIAQGAANLHRHLGIVRGFGLPCVVAVNRRPGRHRRRGGARALARARGRRARGRGERRLRARGRGRRGRWRRRWPDACEQPSEFKLTYEDDDPIEVKIRKVATQVYGAKDVVFYLDAERKIRQYQEDGLDRLPICMAKTHLSLSADPALLNAPEDFTLPVRDIRAYTGAGWLVPLCGDIQQMPGLGKTPAALNVDIDEEGRTVGLF